MAYSNCKQGNLLDKWMRKTPGEIAKRTRSRQPHSNSRALLLNPSEISLRRRLISRNKNKVLAVWPVEEAGYPKIGYWLLPIIARFSIVFIIHHLAIACSVACTPSKLNIWIDSWETFFLEFRRKIGFKNIFQKIISQKVNKLLS